MTIAVGDYVFVELRKFLNFANKAGLTVVEKETWIEGYQLYIVEQWICDRSHPYNTIKIFTGDPSHRLKVCVIRFSEKDMSSPVLQKFIANLTELEKTTRPKPTSLGTIMVWDPSSIASDWNMILIPDGDYETHKDDLYININLRRMNCTGRSALNLNPPSDAQQDKFRSIFKIADAVSFRFAVLEVAKLAQIALYIFGLFEFEHIDGLICDPTMSGLRKFSAELGPSDGPERDFLEPQVLVRMLSRIMSIRTKLSIIGYPVPKDPFTQTEEFRSSVGSFQRYVKLSQTKFLDKLTIEKINEHASAPLTLKMTKVIKTGIEDITGLGRTVLPPNENETSDIDVFLKSLLVERLKNIWKPKTRPQLQSDQDHSSDWYIGGKHFVKNIGKNVTGRTTKGSEATLGMINKMAESFTRMSSQEGPRLWHEKKASHSESRLSRGRRHRSQASQQTLQTSSEPSTPGSPYEPMPQQEVEEEGLKNNRKPHIPKIITSNLSFSSPLSAPPSQTQDELNNREIIVGKEINRSSSMHSPGGFRPRSASVSAASQLALYEMRNFSPRPDSNRSYMISPIKDNRRVVKMDLTTYILYEELALKELALNELILKLEKVSDHYDSLANQVKAAYAQRLPEVELSRAAADAAFRRQRDIHHTLQEVEDGRDKLQYELVVLDEKLKEIGDSVRNFVSKVGDLQSLLPEAPPSVQNLLLANQYFQYYWDRWRQVFEMYPMEWWRRLSRSKGH